MKILCVGQAAYDITFPCDETIVENQKYRIYNRMECMGAPAANSAYLCSLWGADCALMARVGDDLYGKEILRTLESVNVDTRAVYVDKKNPTSISAIIANAKTGSRTIFNSPMKDEAFPLRFPDEECHVILMDGHELDASLEAMKRYPNAITVLDAGTYKPHIIELVKTVDYLVCSQDFARQYMGIEIDINVQTTIEKTFERLSEVNPNHIVVTLGDKGCVYMEDGNIHHLEAFKVHAVDTTGAGDIFHGAFAYCMSKQYSLHDALVLSSLTSAISIETLGGQVSIPTVEMMRKRMKEYDIKIAF